MESICEFCFVCDFFFQFMSLKLIIGPDIPCSKLLHTLDQAVATDPMSVGEAVLDKSYMAQLVEVQHLRGATGGQMLVQVVQLEQPRLPG